jgi:lysophospholipase L1-like esterase
MRGKLTALILAAAGLGSVLWALFRRAQPLSRPATAAAVGDSLTAHGGYVARLRERVGGAWTIIAEEGAGLWRIVQLARGRMMRFDTIVVLAGVNALHRGYADCQAGLIELYRMARAERERVGTEEGVRVIAVTMTPWRGYSRWSAEADSVRARLRDWQLSGASGLVDATVDAWTLLGDQNGRLRPEYNAGDGLHMNMAGQRALGDAIARVFETR